MSPAQMADRIAEVAQITRTSVQHAADLRRNERPFAIDESHCTNSRCYCQRRAR